MNSIPQAPHKRKPSKAVNGVNANPENSTNLRKLPLEDDESKPNDLPTNASQETSPAATHATVAPEASNDDTEAKLEAMARERSALRDEVAQLRQSLEELQGKHNEETANLRQELEDTQGEKENADTQYRNLLGRVNTIKSQLGERLKSDAVRLLHVMTLTEY